MIRIFVDIKSIYFADNQRISCNAQNKRFLPTNDNAPANIGCIYNQNCLFVDFIHNTGVGIIVFENGVM